MRRLIYILLLTLTITSIRGGDTAIELAGGQFGNIILQPRNQVWATDLIGYVFYEIGGVDVGYRYTTDGGATWESEVTLQTGSLRMMTVWFDGWTPDDDGVYIHIVAMDGAIGDVFYWNINTSTHTLSTKVLAFAGATFPDTGWNGACISITKSKGGNVYIGGPLDIAGEKCFIKGNADPPTSFSAKATTTFYEGAGDRIQLLPGNEADSDDIWCVFQDASANQITLKVYDQSANTWSQGTGNFTSVEHDAYFTFDSAVRHSDGHAIVVAYNSVTSGTMDIVTYDITDKNTFTAKTNAVNNIAGWPITGMMINQVNDDLYAVYSVGATGGQAVYAYSDDGGGTWSAGNTYQEQSGDDFKMVMGGTSVQKSTGGRWQPVFYNDDLYDYYVNLVYDVEILAVTAPSWQINIGDDWKEVDGVQINNGDVWKEVDASQLNVGDVWKEN